MIRRPARLWPAAVAGLWLAALVTPAQQQARTPPAEDPAVTAVMTAVDVEKRLLEEDRREHEEIARRRNATATRLTQLHRALDAAVARDDAPAAELIDRLLANIELVQGERAELQATERLMVDRVRERLRRIALYSERLDELRGRPAPETGVLSGDWDVVLLPRNQRGSFRLTQTGTLVTGTYRLAGGFSGSLQGTLVQSKVFLQRIDSQLGRSMELEGILSGDRSRIRGTWQSYELADGEGANGQWSATRREPDQP